MNLEVLIQSGKSVFTIPDLLFLLETNKPQTVRNFLQRMKKKGVMRKVYYGIWVLGAYDPYELACKLKVNSYVTGETVLNKAGVIYQYYGSTITCASDNTITKDTDEKQYIYRKITSRIRLDPIGIDIHSTYMVASLERALCDTIYRHKNPYFDDLSEVDVDQMNHIGKIYPKRVLLTFHKLYNAQSSSS